MTAPVRLLVVSHTGLRSGAERVLLTYVAAARERGWTVTAAAPSGPLSDALAADDVPVTQLPDLKLGAGPRPLAAAALAARWPVAARRVRRLARAADVVLVNGLLALPAVRLAGGRTPVCWLVHDVVVRRDLRLLARGCARAADIAAAVSDVAGRFPEALGLPTVVVRNGTAWPVAPAVPVPVATPIVGINAALTPWKGHAVLLEAVAAVPGVVLEVMGGHFPKDGPHAEQLRRRAAAPDLADRVRFLGHQADPLSVMRRWTIAVNASVEPEAAPLSVLEAMSLGLPVVATAHGGSPEVLGDAGILVPPGDAPAMAAALTALLHDEDRRQAAGDAGRRIVAERFSFDVTIPHMLDVLERVARGALP